MTAKATAPTWSLADAEGRTGGVWEGAFSLLLGLAFTLALFGGIAWYERATPRPPAPELSDLLLAVLPLTPPPPTTTEQTEAEPDSVPLAGFELSPSNSAVKIAATPPSLEPLRAEELSKAPAATIELRLPVTFRPKATFRADARHIYQKFEVDKVATVLLENPPQVPRRLFEGASALHVTLIWVVETDGTTSNVRVEVSSGKPAVDALMIDMVREMVFSPAMKGEHKVRQMTSQLITVKWSAGSPFQAE